MPLRKPGTENDPNYDEIDEEEELRRLEVVTKTSNRGSGDDKFKDYKLNREKSYSLRTVITTIVIMVMITLIIIFVIIYLLCQRKTKQKKYLYATRRNVLTFSNPNYNASSGDIGPCNQQQDKKSFIWKRLKYDKSQVCLIIFCRNLSTIIFFIVLITYEKKSLRGLLFTCSL